MKLFYDDEFDAITSAIGASGKQFKEVAVFMFPDMKVESAYARLKDCCSPAGSQRLSYGQVIRLMNFCEAYDPLRYACDETLHAHPDRHTPDDKLVGLAEVIHSAADTMNKALKAIEHVQAQRIIRAVA
jgi:hypothetical protein